MQTKEATKEATELAKSAEQLDSLRKESSARTVKSAEQLDSLRKESSARTSKHNEAKKQWTKDKKATAAQVVVLPSLISRSYGFAFFAFKSRS